MFMKGLRTFVYINLKRFKAIKTENTGLNKSGIGVYAMFSIILECISRCFAVRGNLYTANVVGFHRIAWEISCRMFLFTF